MGPVYFFRVAIFKGLEDLLKLASRISATEKVLSPYSSKSLLFPRAAAPSSLPESLNFHLGIKITVFRPQNEAWTGFGGIRLISMGVNGTCQEGEHQNPSLGKAEPTQPSWRRIGGNGAAPRGCQEDTNLHLSINRNKHPLQD